MTARGKRWQQELGSGAGVAALAMVVAAIVLQIWNADLHVPFSYSGDALYNQMVVKDVLEHGWYQHNPNLGAPFGQTLYDFPVVSGDNLQILVMKAIGVFTSDSAVVMNLFFLLTFPLSAATAYASLRLLAVSRAPAAAASVLFALLPYHFLHGETHVFISAYYAVPIGAYLALRGLAGAPLGLRRRRTLVLVLLACVVVGSAHVYYAAFTIALLLLAAAIRLIAGPWRSAAAPGALIALIAAVVIANHLPNILYQAHHGKNPTTQREAADSEGYGLKIAQMVLPVERHRIAPLARLRARYDASGTQLQEGDPQALGVVATLGFTGLLLLGATALAGRRRWADSGELVGGLASFSLAAVLIGTVGGFSAVFAFVVDAQLRSWGRFAIFVAFFGLAAAAVAADRFAFRRGRVAGLAILAAVVVIGTLDQTNSGSVPAYKSVKAAYRSDGALVTTIEQRMPAGASVFELPYEPFPEPQPQWIPGAGPYDLARGYVHSHDLRWSYGLMKGRAGDWQAALVQLPPALVARAVVAAGFDGVYVDGAAYDDAGGHVISAMAAETGAQPTRSPDGRLAFLDLQAYAKRLRSAHSPVTLGALRQAVLQPVTATFAREFYPLQQDLGARSLRMGPDGRIALQNPYLRPRRMRFVFEAKPPSPTEPSRLDAQFPDGTHVRVAVPPAGRRVDHRVAVPPGRSEIVLHVKGRSQVDYPDPGPAYYLRVLDPFLVDHAFDPFGPLPADHRASAWLSPFGRI